MNRKWKFIIQFHNKARKLYNRPTDAPTRTCRPSTERDRHRDGVNRKVERA